MFSFNMNPCYTVAGGGGMSQRDHRCDPYHV